MRRILADIALILSVLFLPWWAALLIGGAFFFLFDRYYELLAAALLTDALYGAPLSKFGGFYAVYSAGMAIVFFLLFTIKKRMRV